MVYFTIKLIQAIIITKIISVPLKWDELNN